MPSSRRYPHLIFEGNDRLAQVLGTLRDGSIEVVDKRSFQLCKQAATVRTRVAMLEALRLLATKA